MSPPTRRNPGTYARATSTTPIASENDTVRLANTPADPRTEFDELTARRRRREAAVRLPGADPDPAHPGRRYHRPTTGFRAAGYREGYAAALRWVLREHAAHIDEMLRAKLAAIIKRSDAND